MSANLAFVKTLFNEGINFLNENKFSDAEKKFEEILLYYPNRISVLVNLASVKVKLKKFNEAKKLTNIILDQDTNNKDALYINILINGERGFFKDSLRELETLLSFKDLDNIFLSELYSYRGILYSKIGFFKDSFNQHLKAVELNKNSYFAKWNLGLSYLLNGDYKKGFELYEYRFLKNKSKLTNRVNSIPELKNKKILVVSEQGFGDTIQFARYLPLLLPHVKNLDFHPSSELHDVFKNTNINLVKKFKIENYDEVIPLMSLPFIFKTTLNTIPTCDYLNSFKTKNKFSSGKIKIGLAWSGRNTYPYDFLRSIPLSKLKNIYDLDNDKFDFYCLQKNIRTSDTKCFEQSKIIYVGDKNFFDITKVILEMDLVVSSDTSILHLASSLQIKTFGLIPFCPDWRWLLDKNDSPWYSSLKLYRCNHDNDWNNLSCKVANDINLLFN